MGGVMEFCGGVVTMSCLGSGFCMCSSGAGAC